MTSTITRGKTNGLRLVEWAIGLALVVIVCSLHVLCLEHAGGLWRDEVVSFNVATRPSLAELCEYLRFDSFPALFHCVLRLWVGLGFGHTDLGVRLLGCLIGVGILLAFWLNGWVFRYTFPFFSMVLFGLSPVAIRFGDSIRAYGLGISCIVITFGLFWSLIDSPSPWKVVFASAGAVVSVNCLYQNVFLFLAIGLGAIAVTLRRRMWKRAITIVVIGMVAAVSLLAYTKTMRQLNQVREIAPQGLSFSDLLFGFSSALTANGDFLLLLWLLLLIAGLAAAIWIQFPAGSSAVTGRSKDLVLFSAITMGASTVFFLGWLKLVNVPLQVWHYLPLMALISVSLDGIFCGLATTRIWRIGRLVCVIALASLSLLKAVPGVKVRHTNIDVIASYLSRVAGKDDFILVNPWHTGATFSRYYHGSAAWGTLPTLDDPTLQRLDLLKKQMSSPHPIGGVLERMSAALRSGNRVWIAGTLQFLPAGQLPPDLPAPPKSVWGWHYYPYTTAWAMQTAYFIQTRAGQAEVVSIPLNDAISPYETGELLIVSGWRDWLR